MTTTPKKRTIKKEPEERGYESIFFENKARRKAREDYKKSFERIKKLGFIRGADRRY